MMKHSIWLYILVSALVSYLIRVLPLTLIRKPIRNVYFRSFLFYVPYATLAVMTFPALVNATSTPVSGILALFDQPRTIDEGLISTGLSYTGYPSDGTGDSGGLCLLDRRRQ